MYLDIHNPNHQNQLYIYANKMIQSNNNKKILWGGRVDRKSNVNASGG